MINQTTINAVIIFVVQENRFCSCVSQLHDNCHKLGGVLNVHSVNSVAATCNQRKGDVIIVELEKERVKCLLNFNFGFLN